MAWVHVQSVESGPNGGADSDTTAFGSNVVSGNLLIVTGAVWNWPANVVVTDTLSTSYTLVYSLEMGGTGQHTFIAYGLVPSSGANTVTVNPSGASADFSYTIAEFSGAPASGVLDVDGSNSQGTSTAPADAITTGVADALIIGVMSYDGAITTISEGANYLLLGSEPEVSNNAAHGALYRIATTATAYTALWALGASRLWIAQTLSFKPFVSGGGSTILRQMIQHYYQGPS